MLTIVKCCMHLDGPLTYRTVGPVAPSKASSWMSRRCLLSLSILQKQKQKTVKLLFLLRPWCRHARLCFFCILCLLNLTLQKMNIIFKLPGVSKGKQQDANLYLVLHNVYLLPLSGRLLLSSLIR